MVSKLKSAISRLCDHKQAAQPLCIISLICLNGQLINPVLGDSLEGWDDGEGREVQEGGDLCILMVVVQQKSTQHSKAIILQLRID